MNTRRPLIDPNPDMPLKFYGWRAERSGSVYASTSPMTHGRPNRNHEVYIGSLVKIGRVWVARTESGLPFEASRQQDAGSQLYEFVRNHQ